jgi:hypothetical protein
MSLNLRFQDKLYVKRVAPTHDEKKIPSGAQGIRMQNKEEKMRKLSIILIILISILSILSAQEIVWEDGFESYPVGQFPSPPWTPSGNGSSPDCYVDSTVRYAGIKSLRLYGVVGGFWGALAHRALQTTPPFIIECMLRTGAEQVPPQGHQQRAVLSVRVGPDWTYPGRDFIVFYKNDTIYGPRGPLQTYSTLTWYRVRIKYERPRPESVKVTVWINDAMYGPFGDTAFSYENQLAYVDLVANVGTVWYDEVKIWRLGPQQRWDVEAAFTQQWGSNFAPINIFGKPVSLGEVVRARLWPIDPSGNPGQFRYFRDFFPDSSDFSWRTHPSGNRWELNKTFISRMYTGGLNCRYYPTDETIWIFIQFAGAEGYYPGCAGYVKVHGDSWRILSVISPFIYPRGGGFGWRITGDTLFEWEGRSDVPAAACREANWRFLLAIIKNPLSGTKEPTSPLPKVNEKTEYLQIKPTIFYSNGVIEYELPYDSDVVIRITDVNGKIVKELVNEKRPKGKYGLCWDGKDEKRNSLPTGTYFITLTVNGKSQSKKAIILR